ncbi:hypothetical protein CDN97_22025 [Pantoea sp. AMG 501]|nr:hypothetical protein CDN97_22025 [Pantoea sp. AMG 501]
MRNNPQSRPWLTAIVIIAGQLAMLITEIIKHGKTRINLTPVVTSAVKLISPPIALLGRFSTERL